MATTTDDAGGSQLFVRQSTGLVREASTLDAIIYNAVFSAPVGATLAWGVFFALSAFPGADLVVATLVSFVLNIPVLIMMALLASSMPRTGGDYVWVSRILSPPLATISNFGAALSAMIGATFWARYFPVFALGPVLVTLGVIFGNDTLQQWGTSFQTDNTWIFLGGFAMIVLMTAIHIAGIRTTFRWQNVFWIIASLGTFLAFLVLLIGSNADFTNNFNQLNSKFGGGTAAQVISTANASGAQPNAGDLNATLPTIFAIMVFMMWNWWSVYLSGELKSAANRGRQMSIMFGALIWDVVFIVLGVILLFKVTGYDFMVAVNTAPNPAYAIPTGPWYHFMASLVFNAPIITILIVGSFLFWSLPAMVGNTFMPIRTVFAWAFDRLLPEKFSEVNERTHSPIPAILLVMALVTAMLAWSVVSTDFATWLALGVLAGVVCVVIVAVAAFVFPSRRPDLYRASPANVTVAGLPVLRIVAVLSILVMVFLTWLTLTYPALALGGKPENAWQIPAFMLMIVIVGLVVYYGAKYIRRGQGIDVDLVYRELPPE
ncbi:MAG TPA: APC family permease [Candidatus Limnocylindrales bacterium]|nr:APC family permease [Candidatus Limnocylindrales bacterium]